MCRNIIQIKHSMIHLKSMINKNQHNYIRLNYMLINSSAGLHEVNTKMADNIVDGIEKLLLVSEVVPYD